MKAQPASWTRRYGVALIAVFLAIWCRLRLDSSLGNQFPFSLLLFATIFTVWWGGRGPALLAVVVGAAAADYLLLPPRGSFQVSGPDQAIGLTLFIFTGAGIALLGGRMHAALRAAQSSAETQRQMAAFERQRVAEALALSEGRYRSLFDNFPNAVAHGMVLFEEGAPVDLCLLATNLSFVNAFGAKSTGRPEAKSDFKYTHKSIFDLYVRVATTRVSEQMEWHVADSSRWYAIAVHSPKAGEFVAAFTDISEARRASDALRASEERFRLLVDGVEGYAVLLLDPVGGILTWNRGAERINGYQADEIVGKNYACLFQKEDLEQGVPWEELATAAGGDRADFEGWRVRKNGSRFWAQTSLSALRDGEQHVRGYANITRDITEKRRNDALLRSVLDHTLDGIVSVDAHGKVSLFNRSAERLFGYSEAEVVGQDVENLIPEPYRQEYERRAHGYLGTGDPNMTETGPEIVALHHSGTTFPVTLSVTEFEFDQQRHFVGIVRDLSETRRLETQLHQSQKLEAVGQLAGGVAHDFNNLLSVINVYSEYLKPMLAPDNTDGLSMLDEIHRAGERAAGLTRQLLAFSRQQVLEPRVLELNTVVTEVEKMLRRLIGEDIRLIVSLEAELAAVKVDPGQIEQVIMNLAVNARDAMPEGGRLTIETAKVELDRTYAEAHPGVEPGWYVRLAVSDQGHGMSPDVKARIFDPFFTTKAVGKGTGLGLAVVHGIVRQSGGNIEVYSEVGLGTTFKIYFPAVKRRAAERADGVTRSIPRGTETILLVEDEDAVRKVAMRCLMRSGYQVVPASSAREALRLMETTGTKIDLLLTDVVMPEMSGRKLSEALRAAQPELKVLFFSGYTDDAIVRHGVLEAGVEFLQKPFTPGDLATKVREVLDKPLVQQAGDSDPAP